ncbi:E3 ubiquitin-protein ligase lubel isoform X3 [Uranotaenia lowii]|uniref:E3 ubiquitin-protein ligase lubel isoform X3 n=1 Tax=Uranotaenia lowii TaxID=190385 RepID=UPI0024799BE3|nr:E3 ubiquitin-protein ligase lubel isoform X3 [Uranotaenia lowii]
MSGNVPLRSSTPTNMSNSNLASKFRSGRSMPSWVTNSSDRVGPAPPPPPNNMNKNFNNADPEYEVIDVVNQQQYSNSPPPIPLKSQDIKRMTVTKCDLCGSLSPVVRCQQCDQNTFCASCDDRYHRHPKRQTHIRTPVEPQQSVAAPVEKPPLPPKGEGGPGGGPLPPPRKNKRPGSFHFPSPLLGRRDQDQDQSIPTTVSQGMTSQKPPQPPPSPALSLREKMNSLKRFIHPSNRPLPDPPENKIHSSNSSLDTISKQTASMGIKSVSSTMEKIKNNTAATLDRMNMLQQRYRQHQEAMKADSDRSRRASLSSNIDMQNIRTKPPSVSSTLHHYQQQQFHHQPQQPFQTRWMETPTPRMRSGSVASGINLLPNTTSSTINRFSSNASSPIPPSVVVSSSETNTSAANSANNPSSSQQRADFNASPDSAAMSPGNPRSTSVFNLNSFQQQGQQNPQQPNMWGFSPLHQAQSMAHFSPMHWNQMNQWMPNQSQNGSNMSLNLPSSAHDQSGYPPGWNNPWGGMYPYPMGMMPMMPGMAIPPPRSRAHSRSRAASPALSIKSRKSTMSMRNLNNRGSYINDLTDDEDSEEEFMRSRGRRDRRQRVDSNSSLDFDDPEPNAFMRASSAKHSRFNRDRRGASSARSLIDFPTSNKRDGHRSKYDREESFRDRFEKISMSSPRKVTSDSFTNDSDGESNRRSNKSRSNNESFSSPRKITSDSMTNDSDADLERRRIARHQKAPTHQQIPRKIASDSFTNDSDAEFERRKQQKLKTTMKRVESDSATGDSEALREKTKATRKISDTEKPKLTKSKTTKSAPKKIGSDSLTPDTDGEQKRRFTVKKTVKKNSSTEFIPNDSDIEFERRKEQKRKNSAYSNRSPPSVASPKKSEEDEEEETHQKTVEIKNHINDTKIEPLNFAVEESPPPPAPIVAPDRDWECEFCTYMNEAGVKVCAICCKTATIAIVASKQDSEMPRSPPPDVVQEPLIEKQSVKPPHLALASDVNKPAPIVATTPTKEVDNKKKDCNRDEEQIGVDEVVERLEKSFESLVEENQYENHEIRREPPIPIRSQCPKGGSGEIKQNLESEVVKDVKMISKDKVSTGCGPSPPRDASMEKSSPVSETNRRVYTVHSSIGTSPPPQDMSTQTYDTVENLRENIQPPPTKTKADSQGQPQGRETTTADPDLTLQQRSMHQDEDAPGTTTAPTTIYQRSHSVAATPQLLQVQIGSGPGSLQSFPSDEPQNLPLLPADRPLTAEDIRQFVIWQRRQSLPPTPHNFNPQTRDAFEQSAPYSLTSVSHTPLSSNQYTQNDDGMSYLDRAIHQIIQTASARTSNFSSTCPLDQHKYRAMTDLSQIDMNMKPKPHQSTPSPSSNVHHQQQRSSTSVMNDPFQQRNVGNLRQATANNMSEGPEDATARLMESLGIEEQNQQGGTEWIALLKEADRYKFTADELKAALLHCRDKHPVHWLRDNWLKLIDTVQTLATKYGHEKRENTIGTISTSEAREALRLHKGNIWHAITECIEQRQRKYNEIASKGNFTREDIVTSLTAHHGNLELALLELSKTQLKPFLMRIWGPPNGVDNDSGNTLLQLALNEDRSGISTEIQEFISAHVEKQLLSNNEPEPETKNVPNLCNGTSANSQETADTRETNGNQTNGTETPEASNNVEQIPSNTVILRDIEKLIDQMEKNQANQNEEVLKNIQHLLTRLVQHNESRPGSRASVRSDSCERVFVKSPIPLPRQNQSSIVDETKPIYEDVRDFMAENIQEILPSLVSQVRQELETVPIRKEKTLEDDIRETLINAEYSEAEYSTIHDFPFKRDIETTDDFPQQKNGTRSTASQEYDIEYANIQDFLSRAVRTEKLTNEFERFRSQNYIFDSSSDEARHTAESDYYDIVAVNQRIQDLLDKTRSRENLQSQQETLSQPAQAVPQVEPVQEPIYMNTAEVAAIMAAAAPETIDKKQGKTKRRVSRIPANKDNHFQRRPIKSSSESDFETAMLRHRSPVPVTHIDHVEELRHVVDNLEKIQHELETTANDAETPQIETEQPAFEIIAPVIETAAVESEIVERVEAKLGFNQPDDLKLEETLSTPEVVVEDERSEPVAELSQHVQTISIETEKVNEVNEASKEPRIDERSEPVAELSQHVQTTSIETEKVNEATKEPRIDEPEHQVAAAPFNPIVDETNLVPSQPQALQQAEEIPKASENQPVTPSPIIETPENTSSANQPETPDTIPLESASQSPPKSPTAPTNNQDQTREDLSSSSLTKQSNNLSDLVLDTKRLIQQMKDEIASDMATMEDEDEIYDDEEYFEGDEYEEWSEGDENVEEWDSNEEYDVDENGDFYEYEDEDDDGSVMFSEIAPEDVVHPASVELISDEKPELPKISAALIREIERNSASEVSDLPLDSDFNDAISVIDDSAEEISEILNLAVGALEGPLSVEPEELSEAETVHNSPEASEISEITVSSEITDATDKTLVAEENLNLTMKNVQSLMNAKAVIGGFIRTAQIHEGQLPVEPEIPIETKETPGAVINSSNDTEAVQTSSAEVVQEGKDIQTVRPEPEIQVLEQHIQKDHTPADQQIQGAPNPTHELDATIEMLNNVARDLSAQLEQVSPTPPEEEPKERVENQTIAVVPEYATVNKNNKTGSLDEPKESLQPSNEAPEYVNVKELQAMLAESDETNDAEQYMISGYEETPEQTNEPTDTKVPNQAPSIVVDASDPIIEGINQPQTATSLPLRRGSEKLDVSIVSEITETASIANLESSSSSAVTVVISADQTPSVPQVDSKDITALKPESVEGENVEEMAGSTPDIIGEEPKPLEADLKKQQSNTVSLERGQIEATNNVEIESQPAVASLEQNASTSSESIPGTSQVHTVQETQDVQTSQPNTILEQVTITQVTDVAISSTQIAPESPGIHQTNQNELKTSEPAIKSIEPTEATSSPTSSTIQDNLPSPRIADSAKRETNESPVVQNSSDQTEQSQIITNGVVHATSPSATTSREPSEEPSSFIEINPSQVIIHDPAKQTSASQTSNIYENVEITPSTKPASLKASKLALKIPPSSTSNESSSKKSSSSPSTPPTPSSKKITTKTTKSKTKTTTASDTTKSKTSTTSDSSSRRNSLRKNSIGTPFGPVLTNTVKNMQKEFLSKAQKEPSKTVTAGPSKPKPSKLVQPKAFTNNKLTKPVPPTQQNGVKASTSTATNSKESTPGSLDPESGPSSSKGTPGTSREGSLTSEQRKKLRKKYMETCFSDDYITSDDDDDPTMTVTESVTESWTIIRSLVKPYEPNEEPLEIQAQRLLEEGQVQSYQQAELAVQLIEMRYAQDNAIWAATQCHTIEEAKHLLQKECELCLGTFPMNEIISMLKCTHTCCLDCAKVYFTEEIMHRSITNCNCPYCKEPDLNNSAVTEDDVLEYFSNLDILLKNIVDEEVHDLFQRKLRDRTLMQDPNFKWCVDCSSGFFARPRQKRLICPDCGSITCASCRKPWESQHEGLSCDQFTAWKEANDPELQAQGVARHLQAHGISCPNCKFKYSLSRGGCMHFTCTQCKFEFCFGCNKPFMMGAKCDVSPYCAKLGLHAHHPRNCLFYLRDKDPRDLQTLLTMHSVTFDTEPSEIFKRELLANEGSMMKCPIPLQKETPAGLMDTICNGEVPEGYAGLCRTHYVEYLVGVVSKAQIDPLPILDLTDCVQELRRRGIALPERGPWDTDEIYREMCQKIVKDQIPLN